MLKQGDYLEEGDMLLLDLDASTMSDSRLNFMIRRFKDLLVTHGDKSMSRQTYQILVTILSEEYSSNLKKLYGVAMDEGELLAYDYTKLEEERMVDVSNHMAKTFSETETITAKNMQKDHIYEITRVEEVTVSSGPRQGEKAIVVDLDGKWTYWPNRTSISAIVKKFASTDSAKWLGKKLKLTTEKTMVRGEKRDVIYAEPQ